MVFKETKNRENIILLRPTKGWQLIDLKELIKYKDLLYFLTIRGIKAKYAQSILGVSWAVIQPLFSTLVFTVVFGNLAKVDSKGIPYGLFSFLGILPWTYFSNTLNEASNSLIQNTNMITKVYFPRVVLPLSAAFSKLLDFIIGLLVLIVFLIIYKVVPGINVFVLPLLILILLLTSIGLGMIFSAMSVQFRDVKHALTFLVQLLMYAAPVVYSTYSLPQSLQFIYALNPMVGVIEGFRASFLNTSLPWEFIIQGFCISLLIFIGGLFYFKRMERIFADVA